MSLALGVESQMTHQEEIQWKVGCRRPTRVKGRM